MRDASYEAGYRDGHLQGWLDAMAKVAQERQPKSMPPLQSVPGIAAPVIGRTPPPQPPARPPARQQPAAKVLPPARQQTYPARPARLAESDEERKARRERRDRQNINVTLYVASLLLVAAAALFVGTGLAPMFRFAGVCAVAALFYASGLVLHRRVHRLRPAAVAFTGTGLALIPVIGLALYNFVLFHGPAVWLLTSLAGTFAYIAAALRLESRVLVYLSLTFVVSTAWSGVAVLGGALVWYFVALAGVAVLFTVVSLLRPGWLPPVFTRPLATLHPLVVPAVALVSTFFPLLLARWEYALVLGICGVYFGVMTAVRGAPFRLLNFYAARLALTVSGSVAVWEVTGHGADALFAAGLFLALQSTATAFGGRVLAGWFPGDAAAAGWLARQPQAPDGGTLRSAGWWRLDALLTHAAHFAVTAALAAVTALPGTAVASLQGDSLVPLWLPALILLLAGFVLAARLQGGAELAPFAALGLAWFFSPVLGEWAFAALPLLASLIWLARALRKGEERPGLLVLNARVAATLAVPAAAAALTQGVLQNHAVWFGVVAVAVSQQLLSAALQRLGHAALASQATLAAFSGLGVVGVAVLASVDATRGNLLTMVAILLQLLAALSTGLMLLRRPADPGTWRPTVGELLPLVVSAVMVEFAFRLVSTGAGNVALVLLLAYVAGVALTLPARLHRWSYWWLARVTGTILVLTAFGQLVQGGAVPVLAREQVRPATMLAVALGLQLVLVLGAYLRQRTPRGVTVDIGLVLVVQLIAALTAPLGEGSWQAVFVPAVAAGSAVLAGYVLRREGGAEWFAPGAFVVLVYLSSGNLLLVEVLLGIFALFAAVMVPAASSSLQKGWYFVAARVLTAALAVVLSYDITASPAAVSLTFALVLAAQHAVRWLLRSSLQSVPFQQAAVWITLAGQALLPLGYALRYGQAGESGGRGVLFLELALLLVSAVLARRLFVARGALYFGLYAVLFGVLVLGPFATFGAGPLLGYTETSAVLMLLGLLAAGAGVLGNRRHTTPAGVERWLWLVAAVSFTGTALLVAPQAAGWVSGTAVLALAAVLFIASDVERIPALYPPAAAALPTGAFMLAGPVFDGLGGDWGRYLPWLAGPGLAAAALYALRRARASRLVQEPLRRWSLAGASFLGFGTAALAGLPVDSTAWCAAALLACAAGVAVLEAPAALRRVAAEIGALAVVAAAQRAALFRFDTADLPDPFWAVQWYVVLGTLLAALRYLAGQNAPGRALATASAALLTLSGAGVVAGGTGGQQLWLLLLLAGLLVAGLVLGDRFFVRWGAGGVAACILWAMREYTFALLAIVAVGLIAFAVWRLNRSTGAEAAGGKDGPARKLP
ncbi:hypothetical protein [Arthrobacter nitrophenolicus]|uniref:Uncharacterized protein n=2 Tax=Arthrobacter nitrophenolicus TaxID=683150 RepID=L8TMV6_9MICC|nr:hypothetical protein [Arthrobacter nitrophenolicus]ELT43997.1 hypothetical protein G205_14683 [Arthrobacter nitrophenolicus]